MRFRSHALPHDLTATDDRKRVEAKLGKLAKSGGDRWVDQTTELCVHFADNGTAIEEVWVSAVPAKP